MRRFRPHRSVRFLGSAAPARIRRLALVLSAAGIGAMLAATMPAAAAAAGDHQQAVAALADVKAAINALVVVDASYSTDRTAYQRASQQAINLLAGEHGDGYVAGAGTPADPTGAIGHVDALLDRTQESVWAAPLHGVEANMLGAVAYLRDSLKARELADYQLASSRALTYLEVARGRPSEAGVLGGLEGVLANTVLGVPSGAVQADGCAIPSTAPAYGTHNGYLAWVAVPGGDGAHTLPEAQGGNELVVRGGLIVLRTAAAPLVRASCASHAEVPALPSAPSTAAARTAAQAPAPPPGPPPGHTPGQPPGSTSASGPPALYTKVQAEEGKKLFAGTCVKCHGSNLLGTAAPSVAGNDFLLTAQRNGWTLAIIRYLVVTNMPMNSPSSLTPAQYASLLAFLLASNCYPAGNTPFPTSADPSFATIKMGPVPGKHPDQNSKGVCAVG